jgi:hypothetical protein
METQTIIQKRAAEDVGQPISTELAAYLTNGFKQKFPGEKPVVFIAKETVMKAIEGLDNVSGIRFMYGYESVNDAASRVLLLIPCNNTSTHLAIPNSIILPQGYMANTGKRIGFEKTWQLLYNHTARFTQYFPELAYHEIMRGTFIGINSLLTLLKNEDCAGINFNFGYDESLSMPSARNRPVFEAIDTLGFFDPPGWDFTSPCPAFCDFTMMNNINRVAEINNTDIQRLRLDNHFRDEYLLKQDGNGALVEMYYYVNPSIQEKVMGDKNAGELYESIYHPQIIAFNNLLAEGNYDEAKVVFKRTVYGMMETYLFQ